MNVHPLKSNTIDPSGQRSFPNVAVETKLLIDLFKDKPEGTTLTNSEMEEVIGRPVTPGTAGYRYLASARRMLIRDFGIVIDAEPKVGVRVVTNDEKLIVAGRDMKRARRAVHRSRQKLTAVVYERLDEPKKREWNARMSVLGALDLMNTPKAVEKVEKIIADHVLPSAKTLELFKK